MLFELKTSICRGRVFDEGMDSESNPFSEDVRRIINSNAFKRLRGKTSVFASNYGDHYRNRMSHSIEVAHVAKSISGKLDLNIDLSEAVALSHDLGHPPFGHYGEEIIKGILGKYGVEYDHNVQSFKIAVLLEKNSIKYNGMNLTIETLDGILKHNGTILKPQNFISSYLKKHNIAKINLKKHTFLESQIAGFADDIAYINHDMEDGVRAEIIRLEDVIKLPIFCDVISNEDKVKIKNKSLLYFEEIMLIKQAKSRVLNIMIDDVVNNVRKNISKYKISSSTDVIEIENQIGTPSKPMFKNIIDIKKFLYQNFYSSKEVKKSSKKAESIISTLFEYYQLSPDSIKDELFTELLNECSDKNSVAVIIADFISCMTEDFASKVYKNIRSKKVLI